MTGTDEQWGGFRKYRSEKDTCVTNKNETAEIHGIYKKNGLLKGKWKHRINYIMNLCKWMTGKQLGKIRGKTLPKSTKEEENVESCDRWRDTTHKRNWYLYLRKVACSSTRERLSLSYWRIISVRSRLPTITIVPLIIRFVYS